jgi:hypothetical protein
MWWPPASGSSLSVLGRIVPFRSPRAVWRCREAALWFSGHCYAGNKKIEFYLLTYSICTVAESIFTLYLESKMAAQLKRDGAWIA